MTRRATLAVDIQVACDDPNIPPASDLELWVTRALDATSLSFPAGAEVSVRIVGTEEMQTLNRGYRDKDKVTNVLSFPGGELAGLPGDARRALGDIVVCADVVVKEAEAQGKAVADHWAHMLVHGMLHLLGYDHESDAGAVEMEGLETQILASAGLADPYVK
ncbi:MAG: rRNA maturation RNase YbeY [Woeseiaceae bacterium]